MPAEAFFDTNVLIYAVAEGDPRSERAERLLESGGVLSVQILNEFVAVARRKILLSWEEILEALEAFRILCPSPMPITTETHETALEIARRHGFHIYDGLVVAAALEGGCAILYSEDFQDGLTIRGTKGTASEKKEITIRNPFPGLPR